MIRMVLERLGLFALPFLFFAGYLGVSQKGRGRARAKASWFWLAASGLLLVIASFIYAALFGGVSTQGRYVPPTYVHGQIVPAHIRGSAKL